MTCPISNLLPRDAAMKGQYSTVPGFVPAKGMIIDCYDRNGNKFEGKVTKVTETHVTVGGLKLQIVLDSRYVR